MTIANQLSLLGPAAAPLNSDNKYTPPWLHAPIVRYLRGNEEWRFVKDNYTILDPTADPGKQFPADAHITEAEDCFSVDWGDRLGGNPGAVFMNPPFSNTAPFLYRLGEFMEAEVVKKAVSLTLAGVLCNTQTRPLLEKFNPRIIFPHGRINFIHGGKSNDRDVVFLLWRHGKHGTPARELATAINGWMP